jgi:hypothetical protein
MQEIRCWQCGAKNWLSVRGICLDCQAILRRCSDCTHYTVLQRDHPLYEPKALCQSAGEEMLISEAEKPSALSPSANCREYQPVWAIQMVDQPTSPET